MTTPEEKKVKRVKESSSFKRAQSKAEEYAKDPQKLGELIDKASKKASSRKGPLHEVWTGLMTSFRLVRAYAKGTYREIPWQSIVLLVAAIIYFIMPVDLLPDFITGFGYLDDATLLGWTLKKLSSEIEAFNEWESRDTI